MLKIKNKFLAIVITTNISFIILVIYKKTYLTHLNYTQQQLNKQLNKVKAERLILEEKLLRLKRPEQIKKFCEKELHMEPMKIKQIRKIDKKW